MSDQQLKLKQELQSIILEFCESSHGSHPELQAAWDECEEKLGIMDETNPAFKLFVASVEFALKAKEVKS